MRIFCANCGDEDAVSAEYPFCCEVCEKEFAEDHGVDRPSALVVEDDSGRTYFHGMVPF